MALLKPAKTVSKDNLNHYLIYIENTGEQHQRKKKARVSLLGASLNLARIRIVSVDMSCSEESWTRNYVIIGFSLLKNPCGSYFFLSSTNLGPFTPNMSEADLLLEAMELLSD